MAARRPDVALPPLRPRHARRRRDPACCAPMFDELLAALARRQPAAAAGHRASRCRSRRPRCGLMAQARHVGKLVLRAATRSPRPAPVERRRAAYWITGGLGGARARHRALAGRRVGARHLVLTGRQRAGATAPRQRSTHLQALGARGARRAGGRRRCRGACGRVFDDIARAMPAAARRRPRGRHAARRRAAAAALGRRAGRAARQGARRLGAARADTRDLRARLLRAVLGGRRAARRRGAGPMPRPTPNSTRSRSARRAAACRRSASPGALWAGVGMAAGAAAHGRDAWAGRGLLPITPDSGLCAPASAARDGVAQRARCCRSTGARFLARSRRRSTRVTSPRVARAGRRRAATSRRRPPPLRCDACAHCRRRSVATRCATSSRQQALHVLGLRAGNAARRRACR